MGHTTVVTPTAAERVRSACARAGAATLALPGAEPVPTVLHHVRACGDAVLAVAADSGAAAAAAAWTPAMLELTDRAPLRLREPVRALIWLRGRLRAVPEFAQRALAAEVAAEYPHPALLDVGHTTVLLRLVLDSAVMADAAGAVSVPPAELRSATTDPFWELESAWLQHIDSDHAEIVGALARHLPVRLRGGRIRPLAIDRYGITLRVEGPEADHDVRLPFASPAEDVQSLSRALRILAGCPFLNRMRRP
ncbi:DUF2470 domain-containing protein [Nocardia sp. BMG111209]|uniref:DUF2470 domain-containing protein n=1 Tax=Nocardia sp. BMG111209 TaxID=1160137 RepID=UPI00035F8B9F|nr:DUF2470 domain-containing protein [Nocardia sp. BMG111209]